LPRPAIPIRSPRPPTFHWRPHEQLPQALNAADALVLPSVAEAFGLALVDTFRSMDFGARFLAWLIDLGIIVVLLPFAALWALGLIIGIDFIFGGASLIGMAFAARSASLRRRLTCASRLSAQRGRSQNLRGHSR